MLAPKAHEVLKALQDAGLLQALRDREMELRILDASMATKKTDNALIIWQACTKREQKTICDVLKAEERTDVFTLWGMGKK